MIHLKRHYHSRLGAVMPSSGICTLPCPARSLSSRYAIRCQPLSWPRFFPANDVPESENEKSFLLRQRSCGLKRRCPCHLPKRKDAVKLHAYALIYHILSIFTVVNLSLPYICFYILCFYSFSLYPCCFLLYSRSPVFPLLFFQSLFFCATHPFYATHEYLRGFAAVKILYIYAMERRPTLFLAAPASAQIKMSAIRRHHRKKIIFCDRLFSFLISDRDLRGCWS